MTPAFFGRFEPYWAELRGRLFFFVVPPDWASGGAATGATNLLAPRASSQSRVSPKDDAVIAAVMTVERTKITVPRGPKSPLLKLSNPRVPHHHVWLRFESDADARVWEKTLCAVAAERVVGISDFSFSLNILFRDLQPENVLLAASGDLRLCDFGL